MNKRTKPAIVPKEPGGFRKEWICVVMLLITAGIVWSIIGYQSHLKASEEALTEVYESLPVKKELVVTFFDVWEGDSALIQTPNGYTTLVDAGPGSNEYSRYDAADQVLLPYLKTNNITRIDTIILTHPHADHYGGLTKVMDAVEVGEFLDPGLNYPSKGYQDVLLKVKEKKIKYKIVSAPSVLNWDPSIFVQVLWPERGPYLPDDPNNNSIVFRLQYGDVVYFLSGDMELPVERELYAYGRQLRTTILKIPHHGSTTSSSRTLLEYMQPRLAIFSLGKNNRFGHPSATIVDRYRELGIKTMRTDRQGDVVTRCDGKQVLVQPEFGSPITLYPFPQESPEVNAQ